MYFDDPVPGFDPMAPELRVVLGLSGIFVLLFVFMAGQIGTAAELAAKTLF
jgi:NADH-quinone oxidoreductase subunit N